MYFSVKCVVAIADKIQVKIITSYYDGDDDSVHTLSEKDSETFRNLIVNLIVSIIYLYSWPVYFKLFSTLQNVGLIQIKSVCRGQVKSARIAQCLERST